MTTNNQKAYFTLSADNQRVLTDFLANLEGNRNVEVELRFGSFVYNRDTKQSNFVSTTEADFFYRLKRAFSNQAYPQNVVRTKEYVYPNNAGRGNIKRVIDVDSGDEHYVLKNSLKKPYNFYDYDFRVSLARETVIQRESLRDFDEKAWNVVREKNRISFQLPIGKLDLTEVTETLPGETVQGTKYEVELELLSGDLPSILQFLTVILQTRQENFYVISNNERRAVLTEYRELMKTPYFVGAQPETLQKSDLPRLYNQRYSVTDKADGERMTLFITNKNSRQVYLIDNNMTRVYKTNLVSRNYYSTLLDGELVAIDNKIYFLGFDMLAYGGKDIRGDSNYLLNTRLNRLTDILNSIDTTDSFYVIQSKRFIFKNVFLGSEKILDTIQSKPYKNDGLIFTPIDEPYPTVKKWSNLLKWKPAEQNTIDFYSVKDTTDDSNTWKLYVQHSTTDARANTTNSRANTKTERVLFDVEKLCPNPTTVALTFQTTFPEDTIDPSTGERFKSDTVIEYRWDKDTSRFVPLRTRWDKTTNPKKHGNFSAVACSIWNNIHNPVERDTLIKSTVFTNAKEDFFFERMRRFHNKVKEYLYN